MLRGDMPADLRDAIFNAVGEVDGPPTSRLEARRRAQAAAEDAIAVLRSRGYYGYHVTPDVTDETPSRAYVDIEPGPQFKIAVPLITWIGASPPPVVQQAADRAMNLAEGAGGQAGDIIAAEGRIVASAQQLGFADASASTREVIVDHDSETVIPEFRINAGPLVKLDGIDLRTEGRTNPVWVRQLAPWDAGDVYEPKGVAELERRLLDVGVYESVTVALAPASAVVNGQRPVVVSLADRAPRSLELGVNYSTSEGPGVDARYQLFNRLGRADTTTFLAQFARIRSKLDAEVSLPHWRVADRTLTLGTGGYRNLTDAYDEAGGTLRADVVQHYSKTSYRTVGVSLNGGRIDERFPTVRTRDIATITGLAALTWDRSDDPLNPSHGWRLDGRIEPTAAAGGSSSLYLRAVAQGTFYLPLGESARTVIATRLKLGSITGTSVTDIPASARFYSGGGGSIRGYNYQGVGPQFSNHTPEGGLGLFETSLEVRQQFTQKWGGVAFVDVGSVSLSEAPDFSHTSAGIGFGARYNLGFGPIRADVAIPLSRHAGDPAFQIYLSIGQSF